MSLSRGSQLISAAEYNKTVLSNGVRILTERHPFSHSVAIGIHVPVGTRDERDSWGGMAHFVEHMVFKGTKKRSAFEIAKSLEVVGGDLNAFTTRESTTYSGMCLARDTSVCMDVLADLVSEAQFKESDIEKERQVVLQEIDMSFDNAEESIFDAYFEWAFKGHQLGRPILGTAESLGGIKRTDLLSFYRQAYGPANLIVTASGQLDHEDLVNLVDKKLGKVARRSPKWVRRRPRLRKFFQFVHRPSEQAHVIVGFPSSNYRSPHRFDSYVINAALGGGMTSRLYQKVREERGLVYSIYSLLQSFTDAGMVMVYAGSAPKELKTVLKMIFSEWKRLREKGLSRVEVERFKKQITGQILMGSDDMESRMNSLGVNEMVLGEYRSVDQVILDIEKVSMASVDKFLSDVIQWDKPGVLVLGDKETGLDQTLLPWAEETWECWFNS